MVSLAVTLRQYILVLFYLYNRHGQSAALMNNISNLEKLREKGLWNVKKDVKVRRKGPKKQKIEP